jgi:hypothetical protein
LHFSDVSADWGLERKNVSNAAAYADLDNDGDYDLVVNNLNEEANVLQNHQNEIQKNNYIKLKLAGEKPNVQALGAKVYVKLKDEELFHEIYYTRGYQSSVEPSLTIGVGKNTVIPEIKIHWPDGRIAILTNVSANQSITVNQQDATARGEQRLSIQQPIVTDRTDASGIAYKHIENPFVDFKVQRLVPYQLSRLGGKCSMADVNHDMNDDVFFEGAHGQAGKLYIGGNDGSFTESKTASFEADKYCEDLGSVFFDANGDGHPDLYVVSGGNEFFPGDTLYQDRLYIGDGKGSFKRARHALPAETASGGTVTAADFDRDGDEDLFVGGRLLPDQYPVSPESMLLRNDSHNGQVKFVDVTTELNTSLQKAGMITDALWADVNGDTWMDLIVAGEWMPVRVFINEKGKTLKEITAEAGLGNTQGWWNTVYTGDVDHDGDIDILAGNAGVNLSLHASDKEPAELFAADMNKDGKIDPVITSYIQGKRYPLPSRDELLDQVTPLRKKFIRYAQYANASIEDILEGDLLKHASVYRATTFESVWFENDGHGKFQMKPLPAMVQLSAIQAFVSFDFDDDGRDEILAAGNFYPYRVQLGRCDASYGTILQFKNGTVHVYKPEQPIWLSGDIRGAGVARSVQSPPRIVVSRNNDTAGVFVSTSKSTSHTTVITKK